MQQGHFETIRANTSGTMILLDRTGEDEIIKIAEKVFGFKRSVSTSLIDIVNSVKLAFIEHNISPSQTAPMNEVLFQTLSNAARKGGRFQSVDISYNGENSPIGASHKSAVYSNQVKELFEKIKSLAAEHSFSVDIKFGENAITEKTLGRARGAAASKRQADSMKEMTSRLALGGKETITEIIDEWKKALGEHCDFFEKAGLFEALSNANSPSVIKHPRLINSLY